MDKKTLYIKLSTGKIQRWSVEVTTDDIPVIVRESQLLPDGKIKTTNTKVAKGNNIGRANEKLPYALAVFKAKNKIKEKLEDNYVEDINDVDKPPTYIYAQLAEPFREDKFHNGLVVQAKLNGVRATMFGHLGDDTLLSRRRKDYVALKHIKDAIKELFPPELSVDGEAYIHGLSLQGISSLSKKYRKVANKPEHRGYCTEDLEFHIFDLAIPDKTFLERQAILDEYLPVGSDHPILKRVPFTIVVDWEHYLEMKKAYIVAGYEGIMGREPESHYGFNDRNFDLMKDKDFIDKEYKVVDYTYEEWYNNITNTYEKLVIWICVNDEGVRFNSRPLGSFESRIESYKTASEQLGKMLTVKYQDLSDDNVPNFNVGVCIRDYE